MLRFSLFGAPGKVSRVLLHSEMNSPFVRWSAAYSRLVPIAIVHAEASILDWLAFARIGDYGLAPRAARMNYYMNSTRTSGRGVVMFSITEARSASSN